jgi:hypothetical protein
MSRTLVFRAPGQITSVQTLVDGTVKLSVAVAKELPAEEMATLFEARQSGEGWFIFSPNPVDEPAIPKEKAGAKSDGKTPSQAPVQRPVRPVAGADQPADPVRRVLRGADEQDD